MIKFAILFTRLALDLGEITSSDHVQTYFFHSKMTFLAELLQTQKANN